MNKISFVISAGLIAAALPMAAQAQAPAGNTQAQAKKAPTPSKGALKALIALDNASKAKDAAAFAKALPEAKGKASTNADRYLIGQIELELALAANDNAGIDNAINDIAASNYLDPKDMAILFSGQGGSHFTAKNYDAAATAFERGLALDPSNTDLMINLAETRFAQNRGADAVAAFERAIAAGGPGGKAPEAIYKRTVGIAYTSKLGKAAALAKKWVEAYPGPDSWHNALAIYQNTNRLDPPIAIGLWRLMAATKAMTSSEDYMLYSSTAFELGNYVEAQAVIDAGLAAGTIKTDAPVIKDVVAALAAKPKTTAADLAEAARTAKDAKAKVRVADRYLGMGDYAKALELYRQAEGAAGIDSNLLKLNTGIALARSGDKAGAQTAFAGVSGALQPIAAYWQLYVKQMA